MRFSHISRKRRLGREIGNRSRNRLEARPECARQAADRDLRVEGLSVGRGIGESRLGLRRQEPAQPRRTHKGRFDAGRGHQRQIAEELDRIAKAVIVEHQHALSLAVPAPSRSESAFQARH